MKKKKTFQQQAISRKKNIYPLSAALLDYLQENQRCIDLPLTYKELRQFSAGVPIRDKKGRYTLWEAAIYPQGEIEHLHSALKSIYSILKTGGNVAVHRHLHVDRIDYCTFGNSNPFRIRIVNDLNDNYDYFYIKQADASRIYGLELEHILSPSRIHYYANESTLVEEHIAGVPGDQFLATYVSNPEFNKVRIAKEFVKFNERCLVRLLGDMRSYNYVFDITPDFEEVQFRIRAIDFDQQSYEGKRTMYQPQFFKENLELVDLTLKLLTKETIMQYQKEERTMIARRSISSGHRLTRLLDAMCRDDVSPPEKVEQLGEELEKFYKDDAFTQCNSMGELVRQSLKRLENDLLNQDPVASRL